MLFFYYQWPLLLRNLQTFLRGCTDALAVRTRLAFHIVFNQGIVLAT